MAAPAFTAQAYIASSITLALPAGTVAGDTALLFSHNGWAESGEPTGITGWTIVGDSGSNSNGNVRLRRKVLTAADITAGSVTQAFNGSYGGYAALVILPAVLDEQRMVGRQAYSGGSAGTTSVSFSDDSQAGSTTVYFGVWRVDGVTPVLTLATAGTSLHAGAVANCAGEIRYADHAANSVGMATLSVATGGTPKNYGLFGWEVASEPFPARPVGVYDVLIPATYPLVTAHLYKGRTTATADSGSEA